MTTVKVARLDADNVFFGLADKDIGDLTSGDVVFRAEEVRRSDADGVTWIDGDVDLAPGRYRWSAERLTFVPLNIAQALQSAEPPLVERALYEWVLQAVRDGRRAQVPKYTADWALWYEGSFDAGARTRPLRDLLAQ